LAAASSLNATPTATGGFGELQIGAGKLPLKTKIKNKDDAPDHELIVTDEKGKWIGSGAVALGYGYELSNGIYIGGAVHAGTNIGSTKTDSPVVFSGTYFKDGTTSTNISGVTHIEKLHQPIVYGASIYFGGKVASNILVAVGAGVEAAYTKLSQYIDCDNANFAVQNNAGSGYENKKDAANTWKYTTTGTEEIKTTLFNVVPSLRVTYFFTANCYAGVQVDVPFGIYKELDSKYYSEDVKVSSTLSAGNNNTPIPSLLSVKQNLYLKNPLSFRASLVVGVKF
jgi:hypothetical protein